MKQPASTKVMVLAGGPDRERPVSLASGQQVASALLALGYSVRQHDVLPGDLSALDAFEAWAGDVILPILHGPWGEGGGLQAILDARGLPYWGSRAEAASLCMDKARAKEAMLAHNLPTPAYALVLPGDPVTLSGPVVVKPVREGSSFDVTLCRSTEQAQQAVNQLHSPKDPLPEAGVMVERMIEGLELTVAIIAGPDGDQAMPAMQILPSTAFYDYDAKYLRDDTQYRFDLPLSAQAQAQISQLALQTHQALGCRHMSRVDVMVDRAGRPWVLEVNTIPGFTTHSLVPKAAQAGGIAWETLVQRMVTLGMQPDAPEELGN